MSDDVKAPTISLCMIVKEIGPGLERCLASVRDHVDEINIVVANEEDDAGEWPQGLKAHFFKYRWHDDFAAARNFSFAQATKDWVMWLDDDDVVEGAENLRQAVIDAEKRNIGKLHLLYNYRHDADGRPTVIQQRERLMKRSLGWKWFDRVHEYCATESPHVVGLVDDVTVIHRAEGANTDRNLRLLNMMLEEDPDNERVNLALMDTYQSQRQWNQAVYYGERALELCTNPDARWTLLTELARTNQALKRWDEVERYCMEAIAYQPEYALPYLMLGHMAWFGYQDAARALFWLRMADDKEEAPSLIYQQPADYTTSRWDVEHRALAASGMWTEAMQLVRHAMTMVPAAELDNWQYHEWHYLERINVARSIQAAYDLVDHLCRRGDTLKAYELLTKTLPVSIQDDSRIIALTNRIRGFVAHLLDEDKYRAFYEAGHSEADNDNGTVMNAVTVEKYRMDPLIERLKSRGAMRILDVGCGAGEPALYLAEHGFYVTGLDINAHAVKEARRRANERFGFKARIDKPTFVQGSLETIGKEDLGQFDAVVMMEVIEHVHPSKVPLYLGSCEDLLAPGGAVFLTTPGMLVGDIPGVNQEFPRDHVKEFTRAELEALLVQPLSRRVRHPQSLFRLYDRDVPVPGFATWFMEYDFVHADDPVPEEWLKPVSIFVGPGLEPWDPSTPEAEGLGGSETWAVKIAAHLRKLGHPVVVYAEASGVWDGVIYRHHSLFNPATPFLGERAWLSVISRHLPLLDVRPNAECVMFVAHDVDYGSELTEARLANMDSYCVLSKWQYGHTIDLYPDLVIKGLGRKLDFVANGVDPNLFLGTEERQRHRFIWSSSPDRGLDVLLEWWPEILEIWPDAELHIFYGFNNIDALADGRPHLLPFKAKIQALSRQPGVTWHGRVGQKALAREFMKSQFWLYPSVDAFGEVWNETYCITALEAQMGGCIPIVPSAGALPERIEFGYLDPDKTLSLAKVLDALQSWDRDVVPSGWIGTEAILTHDWPAAARMLLGVAEYESEVKA